MTAGRRFLSDRLDWNLLRTCLVITQESSISRAAARLQVTQLAVSRVLKRLEDQLQCTLILRQGTRFALTEAGEEILHIASNIYGNVSRLSAALESRNKDMAGKVRILCATGREAAGYVACLACVHQQYPRVELGGGNAQRRHHQQPAATNRHAGLVPLAASDRHCRSGSLSAGKREQKPSRAESVLLKGLQHWKPGPQEDGNCAVPTGSRRQRLPATGKLGVNRCKAMIRMEKPG